MRVNHEVGHEVDHEVDHEVNRQVNHKEWTSHGPAPASWSSDAAGCLDLSQARALAVPEPAVHRNTLMLLYFLFTP